MADPLPDRLITCVACNAVHSVEARCARWIRNLSQVLIAAPTLRPRQRLQGLGRFPLRGEHLHAFAPLGSDPAPLVGREVSREYNRRLSDT